MDWLTFFATLIKALAWPGAVVVAVFVLKRSLRDLLQSLGNRLEKAKGAGIELTFGKAIDEVEESLPAPDIKPVSAPISSKKIEVVSELSQLPPAYIVSQAWLSLEQAIHGATDIPKSPPGSRLAPYRVTDHIELARRQGLLRDDEVPAVQQLRALRNQAAHFVDPGITPTDALRYHDIAEKLVEQIRQRSKKP